MTVESASAIVRETLYITLLVSAPMLLVGLVVGIIVSLLQAVTQIQEQTLTFVPKITAMFAAAIVLMPWIEAHLSAYARMVFSGGQVP